MRRLLVGATLAAAGCIEGGLPEQSVLDELRVLAIRADPPEVAPGDTITLDALVVDPGSAEAPTLEWSVCLDPPGRDPARCDESGSLEQLGPGTSVPWTAPADTGAEIAGVVLRVRSDRGDELVAVRRVTIDERPSNAQPEIAGVTLNGVPMATSTPTEPGQCHVRCAHRVLRLELTDSSAESYQSDGEARTEELLTSWGTTGGTVTPSFGSGLAPEAEWLLPTDPGLVTLTFVVRDDRGGVTWTTREALIQSD